MSGGKQYRYHNALYLCILFFTWVPVLNIYDRCRTKKH